jgi:hypothetical protein
MKIKTCKICNKFFIPTGKNQKFCSNKCRIVNKKEYYKKHYKTGHCKCGKEICKNAKQCLFCDNKGKNNSNFKTGESLKKHYCFCGKEIAWKTAIHGGGKCKSCATTGENSSVWRGGVSKLPYSSDWTEQLKESIRKRDNYECQNCELTNEEHLITWDKSLEVHHIDYDKKNCSEDNLISLCIQCHMRTNFDRIYWQEFYQNKLTILMEKK